MAEKIILDALIPREDFDINDENSMNEGATKTTITVQDLTFGNFFYSALRKPDFQRETNEWDVDKIYNLLNSFLENELIPGIILWRSSGNYIFVIDGSHRLSALIAWINDDYGDGEISSKFYGGNIPEDQLQNAQFVRETINTKIGPFSKFQNALINPVNVNPEILVKARRLASLAITMQWVQGNSKRAEESFFKINQQGVALSNTEIELITNRTKPTGLASRAIMRSGRGHNYWSSFDSKRQEEIVMLSQKINDLLFKPSFQSPIKTLDLPIGGKMISNESLSLVFETVLISNNIKRMGKTKKSYIDTIIDQDGGKTIEYLKKSKKLLERINSRHPGSLGLHPAVYFYSLSGRHKVSSYYGILLFVMYLEEKNLFFDFIKIREKFEKILIEYEYLIQEIVRKYRQANNANEHIKKYYIKVMDLLLREEWGNIDDLIKELVNSDDFNYLSNTKQNDEKKKGNKFTKEKKNVIFFREALESVPKCKICKGALHLNSISIDHIERLQDGGESGVDNGQLTHPFCNTTYKN